MKSMTCRASYLALGTLSLLMTFTPGISLASTEATVAGILPPNTTACPIVGVSQITPYVYDGSLDSFDVTVTDPSYVAVGGSVGDMPVDFHYMTRSYTADGALRIHVDIASTPVPQTIPIRVTLLSSRADTHVTCALSVVGDITGTPNTPPVPEAPATPVLPPVAPYAATHPTASHGGSGGAHMGTTSATSTVQIPPHGTVFVGALSALGTVCSKSSSWKLWAILLVLYGLFVLVLSMQSQVAESSRGWNTALILVLLVALIGLWYFSATCRAGPWAPLIALAIAAFGIWLASVDDTPNQVKLLLPENKKK